MMGIVVVLVVVSVVVAIIVENVVVAAIVNYCYCCSCHTSTPSHQCQCFAGYYYHHFCRSYWIEIGMIPPIHVAVVLHTSSLVAFVHVFFVHVQRE
jgi:hypothetical protein